VLAVKRAGHLVDLGWIDGVTVRMLDSRSRGRGFDSLSSRYQLVGTHMYACLQMGKPSLYKTSTKINSAFHPSKVG